MWYSKDKERGANLIIYPSGQLLVSKCVLTTCGPDLLWLFGGCLKHACLSTSSSVEVYAGPPRSAAAGMCGGKLSGTTSRPKGFALETLPAVDRCVLEELAYRSVMLI